MRSDIPDTTLALRWVKWWQQDFWFQAHESWHPQPFAALPQPMQSQFLQRHATHWQHHLGIPPGPLLAPAPLVLAIGALSHEQRAQLLVVVAEICGGTTALPAELKIWLRRLAKGMRTECWLPAGLFTAGNSADSLVLLRALFPALWPRLRLLFPPGPAAEAALLLPAHRLRPLWEAALWQVQQTSGEHYDVGT